MVDIQGKGIIGRDIYEESNPDHLWFYSHSIIVIGVCRYRDMFFKNVCNRQWLCFFLGSTITLSVGFQKIWMGWFCEKLS